MHRDDERALTDSIPMLMVVHRCPPRHRVSRPYACAGSWPYQLFGLDDDQLRKSAPAELRSPYQKVNGLPFRSEFYQIGKT